MQIAISLVSHGMHLMHVDLHYYSLTFKTCKFSSKSLIMIIIIVNMDQDGFHCLI